MRLTHRLSLSGWPYLRFEDLVARGEAHEKEVLQGFRDRGLKVIDLSPL